MTIKGLTLSEQKELNLLRSRLWAGRSSLLVTPEVAATEDYKSWLRLQTKRDAWHKLNHQS